MNMVVEVKEFAGDVHAGTIRGATGLFRISASSNLGCRRWGRSWSPQALGNLESDKMSLYFFDNTDPDGMDRIIAPIGRLLGQTLRIVISKSVGTNETAAAFLETQRHSLHWLGSISVMDGEKSTWSCFLIGTVYNHFQNTSIMVSLGKEFDSNGRRVNQGLTVFGNAASTAQHFNTQKLISLNNTFFGVFIEGLADRCGASLAAETGVISGDHMMGFSLGTRQALYPNASQSIAIAIDKVDPFSIRALDSSFQPSGGLYVPFVSINAYGAFLEMICLFTTSVTT